MTAGKRLGQKAAGILAGLGLAVLTGRRPRRAASRAVAGPGRDIGGDLAAIRRFGLVQLTAPAPPGRTPQFGQIIAADAEKH